MAQAEPAPVAENTPLHVIATAGHVDHGKSSLIVRLTGIDPDRWAEEKRRGLTIDLGFAWATLPSGREIGFVDVPGHERFVRNMLAGVGPVRLVLFVVAADEGWKPQSEEHLAIVDVLGAHAGVVAITKRDLVEEETFAERETDVRERLEGTVLEDAPIVGCSATTGAGLEELRAALDEMVADAPPPQDLGRPRLSIDRSFTIRGAGTVVTGTLAGGTLSVGDEVQLHPTGATARVRSLQTHRRPVQVARPVSRVAVNLAGTPKEEVERGDALTLPGQWRATEVLEARLLPIRAVDQAISARGAYKLYLGSAERDARVRVYGAGEIPPGESGLARLRLSRPVVAEPGDRFVLREAGRRATVAGGVVLDPDPPGRAGRDAESRLSRREAASREELPATLVAERGVLRAADLPPLSGHAPATVAAATRVGPWWVSNDALAGLESAVRDRLEADHRENPLRQGMEWAELRRGLPGAFPRLAPALEQGLDAEIVAHLARQGDVAREGNVVRMTGHRVTLSEREEEAAGLEAAVRDAEPSPPTVPELQASGFSGDLIDAACTTGRLVRVSAELAFTPGFMSRAEEVVRAEAARPEGVTVSRFRELLGTSRKYALPLLAYFDERRVTRRDGDVRRLGRPSET